MSTGKHKAQENALLATERQSFVFKVGSSSRLWKSRGSGNAPAPITNNHCVLSGDFRFREGKMLRVDSRVKPRGSN
jgi:hypothetical protein